MIINGYIEFLYMQIKLKFDGENFLEQSKKFVLLGNPNHLRILLLLDEARDPLTTEQIRSVLEREGIYEHRENTHKALQKLVRAGFIKKEKGHNKIGDVYFT